MKLIIEANREGYALDQINRTMTVGELISMLEQFVHTVPFYLYTCNMEKEKPEVLWEQMKTNA